MLESLFGLKAIVERPYLMFVWTIIISSVAVLLSLHLPYSEFGVGKTTLDLRGLFAIIFTMIPAIYFTTKYIKKEEQLEEKEIEKKYTKHIFARFHTNDVLVFLFYFFGIVISFSVWAISLPVLAQYYPQIESPDTFFQVQEIELAKINALPSGTVTGFLTQGQLLDFYRFLENNMPLMVYSFLIGLLFGAGSIFVLTWNASILSTKIALAAGAIHSIPGATAPFLLHGTIEIAGYVFAGLAGSILSAAIIRGHHKRGVFKRIILDTVLIFALAAGLIVLGAAVEAFR